MSSMPGRRRGYGLFLIPGAVLVVVVILVPFLATVGISFTSWPGVGAPHWLGLANYKDLFTDTTFWSSFRNNVALIIAMAVIPTVLGMVVAAALFDLIAKKFGSRVASLLRALIYLPQVMPIAVMGVVWAWILLPSGVLNSALKDIGLGALAKDWLGDPGVAMYAVMGVMVWIQLGFPLVVFMAGLQRVDPSLYEAAEIDGASWWRRFWRITVPMIRPETYVVLLTTTVAALKAFPIVSVLTNGGPGYATTIPSYYSYENFFQKDDIGYGSAIATVMALVIVVIALVFLRQQRSEPDS